MNLIWKALAMILYYTRWFLNRECDTLLFMALAVLVGMSLARRRFVSARSPAASPAWTLGAFAGGFFFVVLAFYLYGATLAAFLLWYK